MATTRMLVLELTDTNNKTASKSLGFINATATDSVLLTFCQKVAGLTTDTLSGARKVDTTPLM